MQVQDKVTDFTTAIFSFYLSPEYSVWGRNADEMFTQSTGELYSHQEADLVVACGNFNARIGNEADFVTETDDVPA